MTCGTRERDLVTEGEELGERERERDTTAQSDWSRINWNDARWTAIHRSDRQEVVGGY